MCVSTHMCRHTQGVHGNTELPFNCAANQYRSKNKVYLKKKKPFPKHKFFPSKTNGREIFYYLESNASHVLGQNDCVFLAIKRLWAGGGNIL